MSNPHQKCHHKRREQRARRRIAKALQLLRTAEAIERQMKESRRYSEAWVFSPELGCLVHPPFQQWKAAQRH